MNRTLQAVSLLLLAVLAGRELRAQDLHKGLTMADAVLVGRQVGKRAATPELTVHRVQVLHAVRGTEAAAVAVLDWPNLSLHQRPMPRQSRLYCLLDASGTAQRLGLPADAGPYFTMIGGNGTNPLVGAEPAADPAVRLAAVLAAGEQGRASTATAVDLFDFALNGAPAVRSEAAAVLIARPTLRSHLSAVHWSQLAARASGETDDVPYKIALAELCAEQRLDGLLDGLVVSLGPVQDPEYARTVGRIAAALHGENGTAPLVERLQMTRDREARAALLLALGASNTEGALQTLLQLRRTTGPDAAVDAALREHRSRRAQDAVSRGR